MTLYFAKQKDALTVYQNTEDRTGLILVKYTIKKEENSGTN